MATEFNLPPGVTTRMIEDANPSAPELSLPGDRIVSVPILFTINLGYLHRSAEAYAVGDEPDWLTISEEELAGYLLLDLGDMGWDFLADAVQEITVIPTLRESPEAP